MSETGKRQKDRRRSRMYKLHPQLLENSKKDKKRLI